MTDAPRRRLAAMTLRQKIASLLMLHVPGTDQTAVRAFTSQHQPGGLILMPDNIQPALSGIARFVAAAQSDREFPLLIAIDQEGGLVRRIQSDDFPSSVTLKHRPPVETRDAFAARSLMLAEAGISINFGIVADLTDDANSFIHGRALGETAIAAADRVDAAVLGEAGIVFSTLKHFPGHGRAPGDSHSSIPETAIDLETWLRTDAIPFAVGIAAGADLVMVGHLKYSAVDSVPATLSKSWNRILREHLGFDGIVITDDMLMLRDSDHPAYANPSENAVRALAAGNTMLLYVLSGDRAVDGTGADSLVDDIAAAVDQERLTEALIDDAALRLLTMRARLGSIPDDLLTNTP